MGESDLSRAHLGNILIKHTHLLKYIVCVSLCERNTVSGTAQDESLPASSCSLVCIVLIEEDVTSPASAALWVECRLRAAPVELAEIQFGDQGRFLLSVERQ